MLGLYRYVETVKTGIGSGDELQRLELGKVYPIDTAGTSLLGRTLREQPKWFESLGPATCDHVITYDQLLAIREEYRKWCYGPNAADVAMADRRKVLLDRIATLERVVESHFGDYDKQKAIAVLDSLRTYAA